jgi:exonuclease III
MRYGTWNVRSLYRADSLKTMARELAEYNLDVLVAQEVTWDKDGSQPADDYTFFCGNENAIVT